MPSNIIIADHLSLAYCELDTIIYGATFTIKEGDFVVITGESGSGKSTLLKSFYGAIAPSRGELYVQEVNMNHVKPSKLNALRRHIGIVFQDYKLIKEWTIEKNVMLPLIISGYKRHVGDAEVQRLLSHVKLSHQIGKYPPQLSGGEQQRVAIARALAHNPTLVLADEPTGNLDEYSASLIWNLLEESNIQLQTTIIVVTHRIPSGLRIPYRHYHIDSGNVNEIT